MSCDIIGPRRIEANKQKGEILLYGFGGMFRESKSKPIDPSRIARYVPNESVIVGLRKSVRQIVKSDGRYLLQLIVFEQRILDHPVCFAV